MVFFTLFSVYLMELVSSQTPLPVPTFDIDLDESPSTRWKAVFEAKRSELLNVCRFVETLANFFERKYISNAIVGSKLFQEEHLEEMQSLADYLEVDFSTIVLSNVINEIYSRCSSFVVQTSNGEVLLGRNLDYFLNEKIRLLAVDLRFIKEGEVLYRSMVQAGYFGVTTGMRPGAFAISVNQRDLKDNYMLWEIVGLLSGSQATSFAIRYALEHFKTYEEALNYFNHVPLIVGEYICISGINEGAIITRNRRYVSDLRTIDEDNWFIIQSNYDHWLPQPKDDDRYTPIIKRFEDLGQENIDEDILFQLMTLPPTFRTTTLLTVVANPSAGYWKGTAWS